MNSTYSPKGQQLSCADCGASLATSVFAIKTPAGPAPLCRTCYPRCVADKQRVQGVGLAFMMGEPFSEVERMFGQLGAAVPTTVREAGVVFGTAPELIEQAVRPGIAAGSDLLARLMRRAGV